MRAAHLAVLFVLCSLGEGEQDASAWPNPEDVKKFQQNLQEMKMPPMPTLPKLSFMKEKPKCEPKPMLSFGYKSETMEANIPLPELRRFGGMTIAKRQARIDQVHGQASLLQEAAWPKQPVPTKSAWPKQPVPISFAQRAWPKQSVPISFAQRRWKATPQGDEGQAVKQGETIMGQVRRSQQQDVPDEYPNKWPSRGGKKNFGGGWRQMEEEEEEEVEEHIELPTRWPERKPGSRWGGGWREKKRQWEDFHKEQKAEETEALVAKVKEGVAHHQKLVVRVALEAAKRIKEETEKETARKQNVMDTKVQCQDEQFVLPQIGKAVASDSDEHFGKFAKWNGVLMNDQETGTSGFCTTTAMGKYPNISGSTGLEILIRSNHLGMKNLRMLINVAATNDKKIPVSGSKFNKNRNYYRNFKISPGEGFHPPHMGPGWQRFRFGWKSFKCNGRECPRLRDNLHKITGIGFSTDPSENYIGKFSLDFKSVQSTCIPFS